MGDLQVVEEEQNRHGRKFFAGYLRNNDTQGHLANRLGVIQTKVQTNSRVKILKVIKPRLPSYSRFVCLYLLSRKTGVWGKGGAQRSFLNLVS